MTQEHVTITEEVQTKDGLVTQERETLQYTGDPVEIAAGNAAMGVNHPDYVPASERIYTYNEATGMSESRPADVTPPVVEEETDEDEDDIEEEDDEEDVEEEPEASVLVDECGKPVGSGFCVLEPGHTGAHRLSPL